MDRVRSLNELGEFFNTDKNRKLHNYLEVYQRLFPDRFSVRKMVEIGLWHGESAKLWHEYFPLAEIYMIEKDRKFTTNWDQRNGELYPRVTPCPHDIKDFPWISFNGQYLDLVIDDGSHEYNDQLHAFTRGFKYLRPGGLWIIEDTHFKFVDTIDIFKASGIYRFLWGIIMGQQMGGHGLGNFYVAREKYGASEMARMIYGIQSYKSLIVIERAYD